jgi:hypothetical protein
MHGPINVKSPNNISEWQMGFNSAFKGLMKCATSSSMDVLSVQIFLNILFSVELYAAHQRLVFVATIWNEKLTHCSKSGS